MSQVPRRETRSEESEKVSGTGGSAWRDRGGRAAEGEVRTAGRMIKKGP